MFVHKPAENTAQSLGRHIREVTERVSRQWGANRAQEWTDEFGNMLAQTPADRINQGLKAKVQGLQQKIASRRATLTKQEARMAGLERGAKRLDDLYQQALKREGLNEAKLAAMPSTEAALARAKAEYAALKQEAPVMSNVIT